MTPVKLVTYQSFLGDSCVWFWPRSQDYLGNLNGVDRRGKEEEKEEEIVIIIISKLGGRAEGMVMGV